MSLSMWQDFSKLEQHPLCKMIPAMSDEEYEALRDDIAENGLRDQIVTYEGKVLDGWHRYGAMKELGWELELKYFSEFLPGDSDSDGPSAEAFVLSRNLHRRHLNLTVGEKAALASEILNARQIRRPGQPKKELSAIGDNTFAESRAREKSAKEQIEEVAKTVGVSPKAVQEFRAIEHQAPEVAAEVKAGRKSINRAQKEAKVKVIGIDVDKAQERIKRICGAEFFDAIVHGELKLKAEEIVALAERSNETMKKFKPLLLAGWGLRRCLNLENSEVTLESRIQHLVDHTVAAGGTLSIVVGKWRIKVTTVPEKAD
jgi:hypothetical protein